MKKFLVLLLAPVVFAGCSSVSNMTTSREFRNAAGLYTVEAKWHTKRQAVRPESIKPVVIVNNQVVDMAKVRYVYDRWEAEIPVASSEKLVRYQFKFDYEVNAFGKPKPESTLSPIYQLEIIDR